MKTLAIVSSFSESCGNASFTKVLRDKINKYSDDVEVHVVELDLQLLQSTSRSVRRKAEQHIDDLCQQLSKFDAANIQLEAGLFGTLPTDITDRVKRLIESNPNVSVTLHSPRLKAATNSTIRGGIKDILRLKIRSGIAQILDDMRGNIHLKVNRKMIKTAIENNCRLIVHTKRAASQIKLFFNYENVTIHPLKIVPEDFKPNSSVLSSIKKEIDIKSDDIVLGMFGYISAYKGHLDALNALKVLPDNYKLLIFGRQHPQTLKANGVVDEYLEMLQTEIKQHDKKLSNQNLRNSKYSKKELPPLTLLRDRVFFLGELEDDDFMSVAGTVDIAWLPYYENGQDGSGIASICLDSCPKVVCSSSFAFDQLFRLVKYNNTTRFDIGNTLELATRTKQMASRNAAKRPFAMSKDYTLKTQSEAYIQELTSS